MRPPRRMGAPNPTNALPLKARDQVVPELQKQIIQRTENATKFHSHRFIWMKRRDYGLQCSCVVNGIADDACPFCWGTGFIVGYDQIGVTSYILDVSNATIFNLEVLPDSRPYSLQNKSNESGWAQWTLTLPSTSYKEVQILGEGTLEFKQGSIWTPEPAGALSGPIRVRMVLQPGESSYGAILRVLNDASTPYLSVNVSRMGNQPQISELGWYASHEELQVFLDGSQVDRIAPGDWFLDIETGMKWKITRVQPDVWWKTNMWWDLSVRVLQPFEYLSSFPVLVPPNRFTRPEQAPYMGH